MNDQLGLFDEDEGERRREEGIEHAETGADDVVYELAKGAVLLVARAQPSFTSDDVWARMPVVPREPRVLGAALRWAQAEGWIAPSEEHRLSRLPRQHRRPLRVWESLLREERDEDDRDQGD